MSKPTKPGLSKAACMKLLKEWKAREFHHIHKIPNFPGDRVKAWSYEACQDNLTAAMEKEGLL